MTRSITINQVPIEWSDSEDRFTFSGIEGVLFWKDPSLLSLLGPLRQELGKDLFALLIAFEVSRGTHDDYQLVKAMGDSFREGFAAWGRAVSGAGWGVFTLEMLDREARRARVRVDRPWEMQVFADAEGDMAVPFSDGKLSGIFSWAFGTNCRARVAETGLVEGEPYACLEIGPSSSTLAQELEQLQERRGLSHEEAQQASNRHLREHLDRFFEALTTTGEFVWEMDLALRFQFVTAPLGEMLDRDAAELVGASLSDFLTEEARTRLAGHLADGVQLDRSGRHQVEMEVVTPAGARRIASVGIRPVLDLGGNISGYRGAGRDITEQRLQERELASYRTSLETAVQRRTQEVEQSRRALEKSYAELRRLAEVSAHHLQEPVRRSLIHAQRLYRDPDRDDTEWQRLELQLRWMSSLVNDLQRYLALQEQGPRLGDIPLGEVLERALGELPEGSAVPNITTSPDPLPVVRADPVLLTGALREILANAVRFRRADAPLEIRIETRELHEYWEVAVTDNGCGVDPVYTERVFRIFERLTPELAAEGTGIGLALVRRIVESHGGEVALESEGEGRGATVRFTLPSNGGESG